MADFSALKTAIQANIRTNGNEEITGAILQDILLSMVSTMGDGAINALAEALQSEITNRQNAVSGEATTRAEADSQLSGRINAEATARGEADTQLGNSITAITTRLNEGYVYAGIAIPSTNPGTPAGKVFYIALQAGTYTNFSSLAVTQGINILKYNGTAWSQEQLIAIDNLPTDGSDNLVKSAGVAIQTSLLGDISEVSIVAKENGKYIAYNGQIGNIAEMSYSEAIPVSYGDIVSVSMKANNGMAAVSYCDEDVSAGSIKPLILGKVGAPYDNYSFVAEKDGYIVFSYFTAPSPKCVKLTTKNIVDNQNFNSTVLVLNLLANENITDRERNKYINLNSEIASITGLGYSNPVEVKKGDIIIAQFKSNAGTCAVSYCDENVSNIQAAIIGNASDNIYQLVSDRDGYVVFSYYLDTTYRYYIFHPKDSEFVIKGTETCINIFNPADSVTGFIGDGYYVENVNFLTSGFIPVKPNTFYTLTRKTGTLVAAGLACYTLGKAQKKALNSDGTEISYWDGGHVNCTFKTRPDTAYVRFTIYGYAQDASAAEKQSYIDGAQLEEGRCKTIHEDYSPHLQVPYGLMPDFLNKAFYCKDKTIVFDGDSLCAASSDNGFGWAGRASEKLGMSWVNAGEGGASVALIPDHGCIVSNVVNRQQVYDYDVIELSTVNDYPFTLGELTNDFKPEGSQNDYDRTTYIGALEYLARYCILHLNKVGWIIPYKIGADFDVSSYNTVRPNAIISVCEKWGIPYLDLRKKAGFTLEMVSIAQRYGVDLGSGNYDRVHCNSEAYKLICNAVAQFILEL